MTSVPKIALCLNEAVGQATGNDGCGDTDCKFAHSIKESTEHFTAILKNSKGPFFHRILAARHPFAAFYGGRLTKNGIFYTLTHSSYLKYFKQVLVPMEIIDRNNLLSAMHDEILAEESFQDDLEKETILLEKYYKAEEMREFA